MSYDRLSRAMQQSCMFFRSSVRLPSRDPSRNHTSNLDPGGPWWTLVDPGGNVEMLKK